MTIMVVDPATGGVAGTYLAAYDRLPRAWQLITCGAASSWAGQNRYFYPKTDLAVAMSKTFGRSRLPLRYFELTSGLIRTFVLALEKKPRILMYALSSNLLVELIFVLSTRLLVCPVYIVCHDVVPFQDHYSHPFIKKLQRKIFYITASKLIVHNQISRAELVERFGVDQEKVVYVPFPIMDIASSADRDDAATQERFTVLDSAVLPKFLFIGHIRQEKGLEVLLEAWKQVPTDLIELTGARLTVAGNLPPGVPRPSIDGGRNISLFLEYIEEERYVQLIRETDVVVFPYHRGTNSGVLSNVISLRKAVLVSDIKMFRESGLASEDSLFEAGDSAALAQKITGLLEDWPARAHKLMQATTRLASERERDFAAAFEDAFIR